MSASTMTALLLSRRTYSGGGPSSDPPPPEDPEERARRRRRGRIAFGLSLLLSVVLVAVVAVALDAAHITINVKLTDEPGHSVIAPDAPLGRYELVFADGWKPVTCEAGFFTGHSCYRWLCQPLDGRDIYRQCTPTYKDLSP